MERGMGERSVVIAFTILVKAFRDHMIFRGLIFLFFDSNEHGRAISPR